MFVSLTIRNYTIMGQKLNEKEWLRPKEVQAYLGVGHDKYYSLVRQGAFPISKPGGKLAYAKRSDLDAFVKNGFKAPVH